MGFKLNVILRFITPRKDVIDLRLGSKVIDGRANEPGVSWL